MAASCVIGALLALASGGAGQAAAEPGAPTATTATAAPSGAARSGTASTAGAVPTAGSEPGVRINELANGQGASGSFSFFELKNTGDEPADLSTWHVYRCSAEGLRGGVGRQEAELDGVVLPPGGLFTVAKAGAVLPGGGEPDAVITQPFASSGFGLVLVDGDGARVDAVGVYPSDPAPVSSECTSGRNLPESLATITAPGESWQRVGDTGDALADFVRATATPGADNRRAADASGGMSAVRIDELAAAGPAGSGDDLVELVNRGERAVEVGGWAVHRCTASGAATGDTAQYRFADDAELAPGERFVIGGPAYSGARPADARAEVSFADTVFGALLVDADGHRVDQLGVSNGADTACQEGVSKLPSILDARAGESWQRDPSGDGFLIGPRTPGAPSVETESSVFRADFAYPPQPGVAVSELADDPRSVEGAPTQNFIELGNYGGTTVDLDGWRLVQCDARGFRDTETLATIPAGTELAPGETWLAALEGTEAAASAELAYARPFDFLGTGVWIEDADGARVDSVGVYLANEMDEPNERLSPCTKGVSLTTFAPDRLEGESYRRSRFTGVDADDFRVGPATPGEIDRVEWSDASATADRAVIRLTAEAHRADAKRQARLAAAGGTGAPGARRTTPSGDPAVVLEAAVGTSVGGPLTAHRGAAEEFVDTAGAALPEASAGGYDVPFLRLKLDASTIGAAGGSVAWTGHGLGRAELQLAVWNPAERAWRQLDAAAGDDGSSVTLAGRVHAAEVVDGVVELLVQSGPRTERAERHGADGEFEDPADYDLAISHLTDTQYLSEAYPEVYAEVVGWVAANAESRKIAFATHTGDLVQNWVDPGQTEDRARREFETASTMQAVLDDAGVPNSVLPGNHDNKRGASNELFNEYFGPERYAGEPWYAGSIAPGDNSASFSTFEASGARFLMLSLPYAYGERELAWAEEVVTAHPDRNVIVSTHEHVTPETAELTAGRSTGSRWLSRGGELWERVVAPNRNVVAVLSGHFHGLGRIVTEDAGGLDGHTVVELLADYQEFRTHTGERATGFQRLLQLDLAGGSIAVDTISATLGAHASHPYDYEQFVPDNGTPESASNSRPWRILADGLQHRYTAEDDDFAVEVAFQYDKLVATEEVRLGR